jgi:hypothetical protein
VWVQVCSAAGDQRMIARGMIARAMIARAAKEVFQ